MGVKHCVTYIAGLSQGGLQPPQFLADQLTLSQPGGAHYPHPVLQAPPGFSDLATALKHILCTENKQQLQFSNPLRPPPYKWLRNIWMVPNQFFLVILNFVIFC